MALGTGGLPRGRIVEIFGPESSGKTTLALQTVACAQAAGLKATFIDVEHAIDVQYAAKLGVVRDDLYLAQPDAGEQALEIMDTLVRSGGMDVIVLDSVAALVPRAEVEGEMGDAHMALQARLMSQALRKLNASLAKSNTLLIFINQIRSKVGVIFGSPEVTAGGNALKFYSSVRMEIRRTGQIKSGTDIVGNTTKVKVIKNKLAPPFRVAEFDMTYGRGIAKEGEVLDFGVKYGMVCKAGAWYSLSEAYGGDAMGQGRDKAKQYLLEKPELMKRLYEDILAKSKEDPDACAVGDVDSDAKSTGTAAAAAAAAAGAVATASDDGSDAADDEVDGSDFDAEEDGFSDGSDFDDFETER